MDRLLFRKGIVAEVQVPKFRNSDFAISPDHIMTSRRSRNAFDQSQRLRNRAKEQVAIDRLTAKLCRHQVGAQKRTHFGSENQLTVFLKIVERLNSERSARDETRLIDIVPNRQPKHPGELPNAIRPVAAVHFYDHFGVRAGLESLAFRLQLSTKLFEIVDLAVENDCVPAVLARHWLMTRWAQILNCESSANQTGHAILRNKPA